MNRDQLGGNSLGGASGLADDRADEAIKASGVKLSTDYTDCFLWNLCNLWMHLQSTRSNTIIGP